MAQALPFAQEHNNPFGLTTGIETVGDSSVFSDILLLPLNSSSITSPI